MQIRPLVGMVSGFSSIEGKGLGLVYLVCRIMKAIFSVVTSSAAIIRSPSFSRSAESRTTMNSPLRKACIVSSIVSKCLVDNPLADIYNC